MKCQRSFVKSHAPMAEIRAIAERQLSASGLLCRPTASGPIPVVLQKTSARSPSNFSALAIFK